MRKKRTGTVVDVMMLGVGRGVGGIVG